MKAVVAYQKKLNSTNEVPNSLNLDTELEKRRKVIVNSFSLARNIYANGNNFRQLKEADLEPGAEFLEVYVNFSWDNLKLIFDSQTHN